MKTITDSLSFSTRGFNDMKDITPSLGERLSAHGLKDGIVNIFVPGSTGGLTTIEFESGLVEDFSEFMERLLPSSDTYNHDRKWGDGNGFSHLRASLIGPSLSVPFSGGKLLLGQWQQVVFIDFDNRPRRRNLVLQFMGE